MTYANQSAARWTARSRQNPGPRPAFRRLRGYAFDPTLSLRMDTALVNEAVFKVMWEPALTSPSASPGEPGRLPKGPIGEYVEVIDHDPASGCFYEPVDLDSPEVLAQDGLAPSEGNPQFHQQMVYAVTMTTIRNFERALGRVALWSPRGPGREGEPSDEVFVQRLRIYPHALREANAYYSPKKKALLFGYFPASANGAEGGSGHLPGGTVFTCLSHDIIAHETTHALLDGMHRRFIEPTHPDALAFHEAFADIVALFQHFSFPEVLRQQIAKTRGDLASENLLGELAQQFGHAIGMYGSLRGYIGRRNAKGVWEPLRPDPNDYQTELEPHARGAILVAAIFDAFLSIYKARVADLFRIASNGTGIVQAGGLHPDLVNRLAREASKSASHVLRMCIRALDYCPPVDITFGDYLRAIITADTDLVPDDDLRYRVAVIDAFRRRGIYPAKVRTLSVDSLRWPLVRDEEQETLREDAEFISGSLATLLSNMKSASESREVSFHKLASVRERLHTLIEHQLDQPERFDRVTGLSLAANRDPRTQLPGLALKDEGRPVFEVHAVYPAERIGPDGDALNQVVVALTQKRVLPVSPDNPDGPTFKFRGGCTLIFDLDTLTLRYSIKKAIDDDERIAVQRLYRTEGRPTSLRATYFSDDAQGDDGDEPFSLLHRSP